MSTRCSLAILSIGFLGALGGCSSAPAPERQESSSQSLAGCAYGDGYYCGETVGRTAGDLYYCAGGTLSRHETCSGGCVVTAPGEADHCAAGAAEARADVGGAIVAAAREYIGSTYVLGGWDACVPYSTMDCTCLTSWAAWAAGWDLPDDPASQMAYGAPVSQLVPGDLVFFDEYGYGISHVGIYSGGGNIVHASAYWGRVVEAPMAYVSGYVGARRLY